MAQSQSLRPKMALAGILPALLNLVAAIFESLFTRDPHWHAFGNGSSPGSPEEDDTEHRDTSQMNDDQRSAALRAARSFFDLSEAEATDRDKVRRAWKKMSLKHHPDRNNNSTEAAQMMAKVNHHYDVLGKEIDRSERDEPDEPQLDSEDEFEAEKENHAPTPPEQPKKKTKSWRKRERKRRNRARRAAKEAAENGRNSERAEMDREMRRQWDEMKRRRGEVERDTKQMKRKSQQDARKQKLDLYYGRRRAHDQWAEAVREAEMNEEADKESAQGTSSPAMRKDTTSPNHSASLHDIDDDVSTERDMPPTSTTAGDTTNKKKPKLVLNPIMEVCSDDVVIYLRLGKSDLAIDQMQEEISTAIKKSILQIRRLPDERDLNQVLSSYLRIGIDGDRNGILHYAVYYGSSEAVDFIYSISRRSGTFTQVFLKENDFGRIPLDYAKGRSSVVSETLRSRMESLTEMAKREYEETLFLPMMKKAAGRFVAALRRVHWGQVASTFVSYLVGTRIFHCGILTSIIITAWARIKPTEKDSEVPIDQEYAIDVLLCYSIWALARWVVGRYLS